MATPIEIAETKTANYVYFKPFDFCFFIFRTESRLSLKGSKVNEYPWIDYSRQILN
jgi:hypothetical protein